MSDKTPSFDEATNLTPEHIDRNLVLNMIESGKFHPQQFVKNDLDQSIEESVRDLNADPKKENQVLEEVQEMNEITNPQEKRLKQLQLSQTNFPEAWRILYGALDAKDVFDKEKAVPQRPSKGGTKM